MLRRSFLFSSLLFVLSQAAASDKKILVAYYSWYDNTYQQQIKPSDIDDTTSASLQGPGQVTIAAQWIRNAVHAPIFSIKTSELYPVNYEDCLDRAIDEKTRRYRPDLVNTSSLPEFDLLFLGFPNWSYTLPMTVCSFLEQINFEGKTIAPFCVHGTGGLARTGQELRRSAPKAKILRTLSVYREDLSSSQDRVEAWARKILTSLD